MPLGKGIRFRFKNGVRLAFKGNTVVEVKKPGKRVKRTPADKTLLTQAAE